MSPRWGSTPRLTDWPTVSSNVTLTLTLTLKLSSTRVEAGSNTSTVTLRVVGGDKKGSLKSETIKYGLARTSIIYKTLTRPLAREGAPENYTETVKE
jgi:hypothetical protein